MTDSTAGRTASTARQGLAATLAGKVKEVAGAVTGNDSLANEGQLQQAEARARKQASLDDAVAKAEADQAARALSAEHRAAEQQRQAAQASAQARVAQVLDDTEREVLAAEVSAERQAAVEQARVDADARVELQATQYEEQRELSEADRIEEQGRRQAAEDRAKAQAAADAAARARADAERLEDK
jgi:uncharacterized protein YjbJ (UPF0337 family)